MPNPINFNPVIPEDLDVKKDPSLGVFNAKLRDLTETINYLLGARGTVTLLSHLNLNGNRIMNVGAPQASSDALSQTTADPLYSTSVQQAAMEAVGERMLQTTRRLNDGTQQHKISSDLNRQGSIPPSNITGSLTWTTAATSVTFKWTNVVIQNADLSFTAIKDSSLTVTGLTNGATYVFYPYYDTSNGLLTFVVAAVASGSPPCAFGASGNTAAAQAQTADQAIPLTASASDATVTINGSPGSVHLRTR